MGKFKAVAKVAAPVASLGGLSSFLGPVGQIASVIGAVQALQKPKAPSAPAPVAPMEAPAFKPKKPNAMARPESLSEFASFDPTQERSALATKGVNQGLIGAEKDYYNNLVSRSLIGDNNEITGTENSLLPIEGQYFAKQGYSASDINGLLKAIMGG